MDTTTLKEKFIELRAKDVSLACISEQIGVSKRTLIDWNAQLKSRVAAMRAVEFEAYRKSREPSVRQRIDRLTEVSNRIAAAIDKCNFDWMEPDKLLAVDGKLRRELDQL